MMAGLRTVVVSLASRGAARAGDGLMAPVADVRADGRIKGEPLWLRDLRRHPDGEVRLHVDGRLVSGTSARQVTAAIDELRGAGQQFVITSLSIDGVQPTYVEPHPERTPIGPFPSREAAWDYARQMQLRHGTGGGSVEVAPLVAPAVS
ncbi:hypothetical protein RB608_11855 [Nocardioides sp. LHD-245]|uniref:hypothetical protein n=1 Tax=Nocardioides sp. LHD-245 TaxID=3051387 RepID=UPI0027E159F7|nr:hypothetical protein [Nocardioides sp. LHD-245]